MIAPPPGPVRGSVTVPPSKSIANRALVCAALASGTSRLTGVPSGDDTASMLSALARWGLDVRIDGTEATVAGSAEAFARGGAAAHCGLAGTTSRFLTACAGLGVQWSTIEGDAPLARRPNSVLLEALESLGAEIDQPGGANLPVRLRCGSRGLGGEVEMDGSVSSQFVTALMLAGPAMDRDLRIRITGDAVSRPYLELTRVVMADFGASVEICGGEIHVAASGYRARDMEIEGDFSSAAFPLVAPVLRPGSVTVGSLRAGSLQADARLVDILRSAGVGMTASGVTVTSTVEDPAALVPFRENLRDCSDLLPALCVAATAIEGPSHFDGVGFVRAKESDRLGDLGGELSALGCRCEVLADGIIVHGSLTTSFQDASPWFVRTHDDHRLAMALSLMSLRLGTVTIEEPGVVSKSWPTYWRDMETILGA